MEMPFGQQVLQDALHLADGELRRNQFVDHGGMRLLEIVEQHLHVLAAEDLVAVAAHRFGQVGDQHRGGIHHGVTGRLRRSCARRR